MVIYRSQTGLARYRRYRQFALSSASTVGGGGGLGAEQVDLKEVVVDSAQSSAHQAGGKSLCAWEPTSSLNHNSYN